MLSRKNKITKILKVPAITLVVLLLSTSSFAHAKSKISKKETQKIFKIIESAFNKPVFAEQQISTDNFDYKKVSELRGLEKKNYVSYFFKAQKLGIVENSHGVTLVRENDLPKSSSPVFKGSIPKDTREMYVTLIIDLPKKMSTLRVDKNLRSLYSRAGDLKMSPDGKKLILSDWSSNAMRIKDVVSKL